MTAPEYLALPGALLVEDSRTQAIFIRQRLHRCGFDVRLAGNGREALAQLAQQRPALVLTDLEMPEMNGLELVREIKQRFVGLPVVLMTAAGSEEIAVQALRAGARLTEVTDQLRNRLGILPRILPMTDASVRTVVETEEGPLAFQDYFVGRD